MGRLSRGAGGAARSLSDFWIMGIAWGPVTLSPDRLVTWSLFSGTGAFNVVWVSCLRGICWRWLEFLMENVRRIALGYGLDQLTCGILCVTVESFT